MPTDQELEAMCEQAFPPELSHLWTCPKFSGDLCNCHPYDNNEPARSKALALAIEVRDKTERETLEKSAAEIRAMRNSYRTQEENGLLEIISNSFIKQASSLLSEA